MAFTMPVWKNTKRWCVALGLCLVATVAFAQTGNFRVADLSSERGDNLLSVDARIEYTLSQKAGEALENGVALVITQTLRLERLRWWWRNAHVVTHQRDYRLQYHAISRRYVLTRMSTGKSRSFRSLDALLVRLGNIEAWPVISTDRLQATRGYRLRLITALDIDALPRLLRTMAYVDAQWQLRSGPRYLWLSP